MSFQTRDRFFALIACLILADVAVGALVDYKGRDVVSSPTGAGGIAVKGYATIDADRIGTYIEIAGVPDANDDDQDTGSNGKAYENSVWKNTSPSPDELYWCLDASVGAAAWQKIGDMLDLIDDTSPQLGGNLDGQSYDITTTGTITVDSNTELIQAGTGTVAADNPSIVSDRVVTDDSQNAHCFVDESSYALGDGYAYNSYDCRSTTSGSEDLDHIGNFQANNRHGSSGTLDRITGFYSAPVNNGGLITTVYHFRAVDCGGAGSVTTQYGLYVPALSQATTNWAIYAAGNESHFGAQIQDTHALNALADTDEPENYHLLIRNPANDTGEGVGIAFLLSTLTNDVCASIISERTGGNAQGNLQFFVKTNETGDGAMTQIMELSESGNVGILETSPDEELEVNGDVHVTGKIYSGTTTVSAAGPTDNVDVDGCNVVFLDTSGNNVTIGGFVNGVVGQVLQVVRTSTANDAILEHNESTGNQDIFLWNEGDHTLEKYGGWTLVCNGTHWYECGYKE